MRAEDALHAGAERARLGRVDGDLAHYFRKYSRLVAPGARGAAPRAAGEPRLEAMAGPVKTEAVVLRSMRYGEADRILHLYTPAPRAGGRDRQGRAPRAQPLRRAAGAVLPAADRAARRPRRAADGDGRADGRRPCAPARRTRARSTRPRARATRWGGCSRRQSRIRACSTCCAASCRCSTSRRAGARDGARRRAGALAFRLKLLLAAGLAPQLGACASCGEREHLVGFSGAAGGVVCGACEAGVVPARRGGLPLHDGGARAAADARRPTAPEPALGQVERAISETLEHHAHVRLMPPPASIALSARLERRGAPGLAAIRVS